MFLVYLTIQNNNKYTFVTNQKMMSDIFEGKKVSRP